MADDMEGISYHKQMAMTGKYPESGGNFGTESTERMQGDAHTPVSGKHTQKIHHPRRHVPTKGEL